MQIKVLDQLPERLLNLDARELFAVLGGPTIIRLKGEAQPPLFVSVLLHGNETSGWNGLRRVLAERATLPRSLILFFGNLAAAAQGERVLDGQPDFNRIWGLPENDATRRLANFDLAPQLKEIIGQSPPAAALDLHNNTGQNPHYSVVTSLDSKHLGLAYLFSDKAVFIEEPATTLTGCLADICASVALELGPVNDLRSDERAYDSINAFLDVGTLPTDHQSLTLFQSVARVHIRSGIEFEFVDGEQEAPLLLTGGMEAVNFHSLPAGTVFAASKLGVMDVFEVLNPGQNDVTDEFLVHRDGDILLKQDLVPAMYTLDPFVIRQDCLCYFMKPMRWQNVGG